MPVSVEMCSISTGWVGKARSDSARVSAPSDSSASAYPVPTIQPLNGFPSLRSF